MDYIVGRRVEEVANQEANVGDPDIDGWGVSTPDTDD
jgi:hypothetical protein